MDLTYTIHTIFINIMNILINYGGEIISFLKNLLILRWKATLLMAKSRQQKVGWYANHVYSDPENH